MRYACILIIVSVLTLISCGRNCERILQGTVIDSVTGETLESVEIIVTGAEETGSIGRQFYTLDPVFTNESGEFDVSIQENIYLWEYELEFEDYIGANTIEQGVVRDVECGTRMIEIYMHPVAYVDVSVIDDEDIDAQRVVILTDFPSSENSFSLEIGDSQRIPVLASVSFEIRMFIYNELDELQSESSVTVQLEKSGSDNLEIGI